MSSATRRHVGLGEPRHRFVGGEQSPAETVADDAFKRRAVEVRRNVDHCSQRCRAREAVDGRDVRVWKVVVANDHFLAVDFDAFGEAAIGVDAEILVCPFAWHS